MARKAVNTLRKWLRRRKRSIRPQMHDNEGTTTEENKEMPLQDQVSLVGSQSKKE